MTTNLAKVICLVGLLALVSSCGCADEGDDDVAGDDDIAADDDTVGDDDDTTDDYTHELYDPDHVVEVVIEIDPADADLLAAEQTSILDLIVGEDCLDEPLGASYTWFHADVTVDGTTLNDVGIRKKGLIGSASTTKPGLKLKFDKWVPDQTLFGVERMTLNNSVSDPSLVRQCVGYQLFADAGIASPRCNFAHVTANGMDLGVYVSVEPLKKDFLRRHYGDEDGDLYEGTLSDFRDGWTGSFEPKTADTDTDHGCILDVVAALESSDDDLQAALEPVLDVDSFLTFWAMEVLVAHLDGYAGNTNNYLVYRDPDTDLLTFIPWGIDAIFHHFDAWGFDTRDAVMANGALPNRFFFHPELGPLYLERLQTLLDEVWDEDALLDEVERMSLLVAPYALDNTWMDDSLAEVRAFILDRRGYIEASLAEGPTWDLPTPEPPCVVPMGTLEATFDTTWGTLESADPFNTGHGTITGTWQGEPLTPVTGGAIAGAYEDRAAIAPLGLISDHEFVEAVLTFEMTAVQPGSYFLDLSVRVAYLMTMDTYTQTEPQFMAYIAGGDLVLDEASPVDGATIRGSLSGELLVPVSEM